MWSYDTSNEMHSSPVDSEWEVLHMRADNGYLYALDAVTGEGLWSIRSDRSGLLNGNPVSRMT